MPTTSAGHVLLFVGWLHVAAYSCRCCAGLRSLCRSPPTGAQHRNPLRDTLTAQQTASTVFHLTFLAAKHPQVVSAQKGSTLTSAQSKGFLCNNTDMCTKHHSSQNLYEHISLHLSDYKCSVKRLRNTFHE